MKYLPYRLRVRLYEAGKQKLNKRVLSPNEYTEAVKQLAQRLKI